MNASVAIQSLPDAANDEELIRIVDEVIAYIKSTGLNYYVGPFETTIENSPSVKLGIDSDKYNILIAIGITLVGAGVIVLRIVLTKRAMKKDDKKKEAKK